MAKYPGSIATNADLLSAANRASTALAAALAADATEIEVASTALFPDAGVVTIDDERIKYESKTATKFLSCTRGFDSSAAAAHASGATVEGRVVAAHHNLLRDEIVALEAELGASPSGTYDTVADRLGGVDAALAGKSDLGHTHAESDVTNLVEDLANKSDVGHGHVESDVEGLVADLAAKVPQTRQVGTASPLSGGGALSADLTLSMPAASASQDGYLTKDDWSIFNGKANASHTHPESDVINLVADLAGKSDVGHGHAQSDVTNLVSDLASKVPTSRQVTTNAPLSGGGALSADLTLSIPAATQAQDGYLKKEDWADFSNAVSWALEALTADRTYYVRTDGNDSNDGLENNAQHAWKTIQHAVRWVAGHLNLNGYTCYIQVADGNYDETNGVRLLSDPVGPGFVYVQGNSGNYNAVVVDASSQGTGTVYARGSIKYVFRWMKVQNTAASGDRAAFYADTLSMITVKDLNVGTVGNAAFLGSDSGKVLVQGSIGCAGNAAALIYAKFHGIVVVSGATITLSGNPSYSVATVYALAVSFVGFFSTTWSGSATGKRYSGDTLSLIETLGMGATWIPGSVAGTVTNGAVYH